MHPLCIDRWRRGTSSSSLNHCLSSVVLMSLAVFLLLLLLFSFFFFRIVQSVTRLSCVQLCEGCETRIQGSLTFFLTINISHPLSRLAEARIMKQQKSRRKDRTVRQSSNTLKHVVNVSHGQKPYLDYSCKVVISLVFFSRCCNLKKCYLQVRLRDRDCANLTVAKDKEKQQKAKRGGGGN